MEKYLEIAVKAAIKGGEVLKNNFGKIETYEEKKANDFVSYVDFESERVIKETILENFPDHDIWGEELGNLGKESNYMWVIDPLDGTKNFLHGIDVFAISCALLYKGLPIVGVVFNPLKNELYTAIEGQGAYKNGKRIQVLKNLDLKLSLFATAFPFREKSRFNELNDIFKQVYFEFSDVRRLGSAALDLCYTAEGIFSVFYEYGLSIWDIAAGSLIVMEAGGLVTDFLGGYDYLRTGNIVAGSTEAVERVLNVIKRSGWTTP